MSTKVRKRNQQDNAMQSKEQYTKSLFRYNFYRIPIVIGSKV